GMWRDAPIFGHGLSTFTQVYPFYQTLDRENSVVLHPESSWLQWLDELGLLLVIALCTAGGIFLLNKLREARDCGHGFYLRAGGFATFTVLLVHSAWDVPGH